MTLQSKNLKWDGWNWAPAVRDEEGEFYPLQGSTRYSQLSVFLPLTAAKVLLILPVFPVILPGLHMF